MWVSVFAGANSSMALVSGVHSGSAVDVFFNRRAGRNFTFVRSKQGIC